METNFNFNSAVCTSIEQSRKLLSLGLKKETADITWFRRSKNADWETSTTPYQEWIEEILPIVTEYTLEDVIPAWSLHRLLSILNEDDSIIDVTVKDGRYGIHSGYDTEWYDDLYDGIIAVFDELIKEGLFNKEYLEE